MTVKELYLKVQNVEQQLKNLASRPVTARADNAVTEAKAARSEAVAAGNKAVGYEDAITTLALAQEELFTEIIPALFEEKEV